MHELVQRKICLFLFVAAFLFAACSFLDNSIQTPTSGSVTFQINGSKNRTAVNKAASDSSINLEDGSILEVALKGSYEAVQTTVVKNNTASLSFAEIPVGTRLWAEASIYKNLEGNNKQILFTGKSAEVIITAGENPLSIKMTQYNTSSESSDSPSDPNVPENQGDSGNTGSSSGSEDPNSTSGQNGSIDPNGTTDPNGSSGSQEPEIIYIDIYVSASGNDTTGDGLTLDTAFKTINRACDYIVDNGTADDNWKILVNGTITGLNGGVSENYGPTTIPEELTTSMAKSILITGATPQTDWTDENVPEDVIDRGLAATTNNTTNGNAVVVNTEVPVTFENIKITRGCAGNGSAMQIAEGATVKLGNGLLITKNYGGQSGYGTVLNKGTLFMYGSAVIGNKSAGSLAENSSSTNNVTNETSANYAGHGGGICNGTSASTDNIQAKLYLGYKGYGDDGVTPVKSTLSGGIYQNGGGGIYNSYHSCVYFDSGNIKWNAYGNGGGIRNYADATLIMTGGNIMNNYASDGGGIYNERDSSNCYMSGGTITKNTASNNGGGVYNGGQFYMSGLAVIGDVEDSTKPETLQAATASEFGNKGKEGGGIYNYYNSSSGQTGKLYLGYSGLESDNVTLKESSLTGGIYHNYSTYNESGETKKGGGGAIYSSGTIKMASGTIANNYAVKNGGAINNSYSANGHTFEISGGTIRDNSAAENGGAIYMLNSGSHRLSLSGSPSIPAVDTGVNDIYLDGSGTNRPQFTLADNYSSNDVIRVTAGSYVADDVLINFSTNATTAQKNSLSSKFTITVQDDSGEKKIWVVKPSSTGAQIGVMKRPEVGDILFNDGTAVAYYEDLSLSEDQLEKAIAVIFNTSYYDSSLTPHTLGLGLKQQSNLAWCSDSAKAVSKKITTMVCSQPGGIGYSSTDYVVGSNSLNDLSTYLSENDPYISDTAAVTLADNYPAFNFAENYSQVTGNNVAGTDFASGWYLPTPKELSMVYDNSSTVVSALGKCGVTFSDSTYYWTCAQYTVATQADLINITTAGFSSDEKTSTHNVCAIREF